jgi:hypothetical protein
LSGHFIFKTDSTISEPAPVVKESNTVVVFFQVKTHFLSPDRIDEIKVGRGIEHANA